MKRVTYAISFLASLLFAVAAQAQETGVGTSNVQDPQAQGTIPPQDLPAAQQGAPREQAGLRLQPQQPGVDTRQNVVQPGNRFGQRRGFNLQSGAPDPLPSPAEREAQGFDAPMQSGGQRDAYDTAQGGRGELGVWLAASAGPGVEIRQVTAGSAAEEIGLRAGDVLLQVNGRAVSSPMEVQRIIRAIPAGQSAALEVWRDGTQQEVDVTLQPIRESYQSGYRGESQMPARSGDLESRTMRLEEQLSMVMRELQQLRQQMAQMHPDSGARPDGGQVGVEQPARLPPATPFDSIGTTQPSSPAPGEAESIDAQGGLFGEEPAATQPAELAQPQATATEPDAPATEQQPAESEPTTDLFGEEPAEPETESTPTDETEAETEEERDTDTSSLFE